jgi:hypothetical protein
MRAAVQRAAIVAGVDFGNLALKRSTVTRG